MNRLPLRGSPAIVRDSRRLGLRINWRHARRKLEWSDRVPLVDWQSCYFIHISNNTRGVALRGDLRYTCRDGNGLLRTSDW